MHCNGNHNLYAGFIDVVFSVEYHLRTHRISILRLQVVHSSVKRSTKAVIGHSWAILTRKSVDTTEPKEDVHPWECKGNKAERRSYGYRFSRIPRRVCGRARCKTWGTTKTEMPSSFTHYSARKCVIPTERVWCSSDVVSIFLWRRDRFDTYDDWR